MAINFPVTQWFVALLLLIVAAGAGTLAQIVSARLGARPWLVTFLMLFFFGLVILFVKVS